MGRKAVVRYENVEGKRTSRGRGKGWMGVEGERERVNGSRGAWKG